MLKFVFQNYLKDEYQTLDTNSEHDCLDDCYKDLKNDYKNEYTKEDTDERQKNNKFAISVTNDYHYIDKKNNNLKDDYGFFIDFETMEREVPFIKKRIQPMSDKIQTRIPSTRIPTQNSNTTSKEYVHQLDDEKKKPADKNPEILFLCLTTMSIVIILTFA